jgi:hypothetical protein
VGSNWPLWPTAEILLMNGWASLARGKEFLPSHGTGDALKNYQTVSKS